MAPDLTMEQLLAQVDKLAERLDQRSRRCSILNTYYDGESPMPAAVKESKLTQAYRRLMPVADAPWGSLIVDSVLDRLEIGGVRDPNQGVADKVWEVWQQNHMDSESKLAHCSALIHGRAFTLVWPNADGDPEISLDTAEQMIVQYEEGSRHKRRAALRRWVDCDTDSKMATLYRPEGIYKFQEPGKNQTGQGNWLKREVPDEPWPVPNPFGVVPVNEIRFNSRLRAGEFGDARGEYAHCMGLIDRINLLTFLGLVVAFWMGFPVRAVIGDKILRDDDGNVIPPFDVKADSIVQMENPQAKFDTFPAADRNTLMIYPELSQLAAITKTPRHYFPLAQPNVNISADAIRADEGTLNAKVSHHKASSGEGWEGTLELCGLMGDNELSPQAELIWIDRESRSLAERADAAIKLNTVMPHQWIWENVLLLSQDAISRLETLRASDALSQLVAAAAKTPEATGPGASGTASQNGNGNTPDLTPTPAPG